MKTYLITGGAGFIGSNFVLYMLKKYGDIRIINLDKLTYAGNLQNLQSVSGDERHIFLQADVRDVLAVREVFKRYEPDALVNFAAESHVDRSIENPGIFADTNVLGTVNLLNQALAAWGDGSGGFKPGVKFVQISTDEVYGSLGPKGLFTETTPLDPHSPYSASKASADLFVKAYADTFKLPVNITRCSNNYGPYQFPEKLIPLMIHNALNYKPLPVYGDGLNVRDWIYVMDHCKAVDLVLQEGVPGETYNIGGFNERANITIVKTILAYLNKNVDASIDESLIRFVEDRKGHDRRYAIDPAKIGKELGWAPETPFERGLERTIEWYLDNDAWLKGVTSGAYLQYYERMYGDR